MACEEGLGLRVAVRAAGHGAQRTGREVGRATEITFYGCSFICDATGAMVAEANRTEETVLLASFDLEAQKLARNFWGLFRDRRPELYKPLISLDGLDQ